MCPVDISTTPNTALLIVFREFEWANKRINYSKMNMHTTRSVMLLGFCFGVCTVAASEAARDAYGESAVDAGEASNSTSSPLLCEPGK